MSNTIVLDTFNKLKTNWLVPFGISLLGLCVISPLSMYMYDILFYGKFIFESSLSLSKLTCVASGLGIGWKVGDYMSITDYNEIIYNDNIWNLLNEKIIIKKYNEPTPYFKCNSDDIIKDMNNLDNEYGKLYYFLNIVFIERFNKSEDKIIKFDELNIVIKLLIYKNPYYSKYISYNKLKKIIKNKIYFDLSSYIHFFYSLKNYENNKYIFITYNKRNIYKLINHFHKNELNISLDDTIDIINKSSLIFRDIISKDDIQEKIKILVNTVRSIEFYHQKKYKKPICCDDLLPILTIILVYNYDICYNLDIQKIYDHLEDDNNIEGYISTIMMSAYEMFISYTKNTNEFNSKLIRN